MRRSGRRASAIVDRVRATGARSPPAPAPRAAAAPARASRLDVDAAPTASSGHQTRPGSSSMTTSRRGQPGPIRPAVLRSHLQYVHRRGLVGLTLAHAERRRRLDGTLPASSVVVTFDDGYASTAQAKPILDEFGYPATVFVVSGLVESGEPLRWPGIEMWSRPDTRHELEPLGWRELERLVAGGWEVGSHTVTHPLLTEVSDDALAADVEQSRRTIAKRLGRCETLRDAARRWLILRDRRRPRCRGGRARRIPRCAHAQVRAR